MHVCQVTAGPGATPVPGSPAPRSPHLPPPTGPVHFRLGLFFFHFLWVGESEPTRVLLFRARSHMSQDHRSQSRRGRPWSTCRLKLLLYGLGKWARGSCLRSHCPLGVLGPLGPKAQNEGVTQTWQHNAFPLKQGFCYRNLMQPGPQIHVEYLLGGVSSQVPLPGASSLNSQAKTQGMTTWALISSPPFSHLLSHLCASVWTRGIYFKLGATIQSSLIYLVAQIVPALAVRSFLLAPATL